MIGRGAAVAEVGKGIEPARQDRVRGLAGRPCRAHVRVPATAIDAFWSWALGLLRQGTRRPRRSIGADDPGIDWSDDDDDAVAARPVDPALTGDRDQGGSTMADETDYDVIIIGSGAGGGTLARHLAAVRQADPDPRARRLAAARGRRTGTRRRSSSRTATSRRRRGTTTRTSRSSPGIHYAVGGATKMYGAALYRLRPAGLRRAARITTASRPPGPSATTRWSRTTRRPSSCTRSTATTARTRPRATPARRTRSRRLTHEPRIQQLSDDLERAGYHPFHAPCGVRLLADDLPDSRCIRVPDVRRLPVPGAGQVGCRDARASGRRSSTRTSRSGRRTTVAPARDERRPARAVDRRRRRARRRPARPIDGRHRGRVRRGRQLRQAPARVAPTTATRTGSPTAPGRSAATTCSTTAWPSWRSPRSRTRRCSRRRSGSTTSTSACDGLRVPDGQHPDGRQVRRGDVQGREAARDQARARCSR